MSGRLFRVSLLTLAVAAVWTSSAASQPTLRGGDYALSNRAWNGLSDFVSLAERADAELQPKSGVDFSALGPNDRLMIIYPTKDLDASELARFVVDGGRVVLADDQGSSEPVLERLGIERVALDARGRHEHFFLGRAGLPLLKPGGRHPLLKGVDEVVANHPAALRTDGGAILPFDDGESGLVYDMRLGRGKVVVIGDASLFINHMLDVKDNRRFVKNCLKYLCLGVEDCRPHLLVGDFVLSGRYESQNEGEEKVGDAIAESMDLVNKFIEEMASYVPARNAVYFASLVLMVGLVIFMITVFTWRRAAVVAPETGPPAHVRPLSEFEWNLLRYERGGFQANQALPMSILKTYFEERFFAAVAQGDRVPGQDESGRGVFLRTLTQRYVERYKSGLKGRARRKCYNETLEVLRLFSRIPPRHRLFLDSEAYFSERDLAKVYTRSQSILDAIGKGANEQH